MAWRLLYRGGSADDGALQWRRGEHGAGSALDDLKATVEVGALEETQPPCVMHGGFVARADRPDHRLFGVSRAEAGTMDPQQRLLLERVGTTAARTLEAGWRGCLGVAATWACLWALSARLAQRRTLPTLTPSQAEQYRLRQAGCRLCSVCRAHVSVDTACSSALVAAHNGSHAVRSAECIGAVALGVSLKLVPYNTLSMTSAGMLSIDGRCKTLDARANGMVRT